MFNCENACVVIEEFKPVALLDKISAIIVSKDDCSFAFLLLADTATSYVIGKGIAVKACQLSEQIPVPAGISDDVLRHGL